MQGGLHVVLFTSDTLYQFILTTNEKLTMVYPILDRIYYSGTTSQEATWDEISTLGYFYYQLL